VNSGADFEPDNTVPVPAGGFVRRIAGTPHYDGVKRDAKQPAVIALFGMAPVQLKLVDPGKQAGVRSRFKTRISILSATDVPAGVLRHRAASAAAAVKKVID
jgi:hypothetical protein